MLMNEWRDKKKSLNKKIQQCLFRMAKHQSSVEFRMKRIIARYEGLMVYFPFFSRAFPF